MKKTLILFLFCVGNYAFSGTETGNGGDAIVCYDSNRNIESVRLLDYYEGIRKERIKEIELGSNSGAKSYDQKVHYALNRLEKLNPTRAKLYRKWYTTFFSKEEFKWGDKLVNIADTGVLDFPNNCEVLQIAAQEEPMIKGDKRYTIRKSLWNKMDEDHKAGLILHELIYREAKNQKVCTSIMNSGGETRICKNFHRKSKRVRYYNSILSSSKMNDMTLDSYIEVVQTALLKYVDINGIPLDSFGYWQVEDIIVYPKIDFHTKNIVKSWSASDEEDAYIKWSSSISKCDRIVYSGHKGCLNRTGKVTFYENGSLQSPLLTYAWTEGKKTMRLSDTLEFLFSFSDISLYFNEKKELKKIQSVSDLTAILKIPNFINSKNYRFSIYFSDPLYLSPLGNIIDAKAYIKVWSNGKIIAKLHRPIFSESGNGNLLKVCYRKEKYTNTYFCSSLENILIYIELKDIFGKSFESKTRGGSLKSQKKSFENANSKCESFLNSELEDDSRKYINCLPKTFAKACSVSGKFRKKSLCRVKTYFNNSL